MEGALKQISAVIGEHGHVGLDLHAAMHLDAPLIFLEDSAVEDPKALLWSQLQQVASEKDIQEIQKHIRRGMTEFLARSSRPGMMNNSAHPTEYTSLEIARQMRRMPSIGSLATTRDMEIQKICLLRDRYRCVASGYTDPDVCHVLLYSISHGKSTFLDLIKMFCGEWTLKFIQSTLLKQTSDIEYQQRRTYIMNLVGSASTCFSQKPIPHHLQTSTESKT